MTEPDNTYRYQRVFAYASLQFHGHIEEYLAAHTKELLVFLVQPRFGTRGNFIRRYTHGKLVSEQHVRSMQNPLAYYGLWLVHHWVALWRFAAWNTPTLVIGTHPIVFFGMSGFRLFKPIRCVYWMCDYFPGQSPVILLFERLKKFYQHRVFAAYYLSDAINRVMNGTVMNTPLRRTVMFGVKPLRQPTAQPHSLTDSFHFLFVGLVKPGQGLETVLRFMKTQPDCRLSLLGVCVPGYADKLRTLIDELGLEGRVFFTSQFVPEPELLKVAETCHAGLALYDVMDENFTHYADPGKVKTYLALGLPVVMSRISGVVPHIEQFHCGEIIDADNPLSTALQHLRRDYDSYAKGVAKFVDAFNYSRHYEHSFVGLEALWKQ
jgi:glycosyltransferase involved in cell wall biosynthesis